MFILDSLMVSGIRWVLDTVVTAAEAEMDDDTALREQLLEAEMRREMGEITDQGFREIEADLLGRIREIKERREGPGVLAFGAQPMETSPGSTFHVEASVSGDFYEPSDAPHTTVIESTPTSSRQAQVLDMEPGSRRPDRSDRAGRSGRSGRSDRSDRSDRSETTEGTGTGSRFTAAPPEPRPQTTRTGTTRATRTGTARTTRTDRTIRTDRSRTARTSRTKV